MEHATYFKEFLRDEVNLAGSSLDKLRRRVEAVYKALRADEMVGPIITGKIPQGSWAHRLIIKPKPDGEFDADFLLGMDEVKDWEPKQYLNEVYNALHRHSVHTKQDHGRKCRCVFLKYAPENSIGCHLDIVPFVTLGDRRRVIVNRDKNVWEPASGSTDPQGFSEWVLRRDELTDKNFRKVVRLMKYLRDERGSFNGVKSVILTTVLGMQVTEASAFSPERYTNLPTALLHVVEDLDNWLQIRPTKQHLPNPNGDGTDFDHRWTQATYSNFRNLIHKIAADMRAAYDETDKAASIEAWQALFGSKFRPPQPSKTKARAAAPLVPAAAIRTSRVGRAG
jgi:hypothetical protein